MTIYNIIQTSIKDDIEKFLNTVNEKYSIKIKRDIFSDVTEKTAVISVIRAKNTPKTTTKTTTKTVKNVTSRPKKTAKKGKEILNFIEGKVVKLKCRELDHKRVVYKNYIIDKKSNCVIGKLDKDNKECFLTKDDCEECKDMGINYVF